MAFCQHQLMEKLIAEVTNEIVEDNPDKSATGWFT